MRSDATWFVYPVFLVQIGTNRHSEELIRALWVFIDIFGHSLAMIAVRSGISMNCFESLVKIEYSNIFFVALSFVGTEIGLFFATFVDNRYDKGCLLGVGVYREIELCLFAFFWLSLYADKKYVSNTTIKFNKRQKNHVKSNWLFNYIKLYKICRVHHTKLFRSLLHHTIMDMSLLNESIVPSLFPRDVLRNDNTR